MQCRLALLISLLVASSLHPACAAGLDQPTQEYLEGLWLVDQAPDKGACLSHNYSKEQFEFEFRKSGGRVLGSTPMDPYVPFAISGTDTADGILLLSARMRDGTALPFLRVRLQPPDRLELLPKEGESPDTAAKTAYRCEPPDRAVNAAASSERLAVLMPDGIGGAGFVEAVPGLRDEEICAGTVQGRKIKPRPRKLLFELFGPVHYWLLGDGFGPGKGPVFDYVRSIEVIDDRRLKLHLQKHLKAAAGWDVPASRGARYDLTIIDRGGRIEIPEWSASFVHCAPDDPNPPGLHRH